MDTSVRRGISYPDANRLDPPDIPAHIINLVNKLDLDAEMHWGLASALPTSSPGSPGMIGRLFWATDAATLQFDYGTGWITLYPQSGTADGSITTAKLADGAVTSQKIADGTIATADMAVGAVTLAKIDAAVPLVPVGSSLEWDYAAASIPTWSALQYGQALSRTTYAALAALAAAAGYPHGSGDGSTTFNIADKRGRISAGKDDMGGTAANRITAAISGTAGTVLGAAVGAEGVSITTVTMPSHNHGGTTGINSNDHTHSGATNSDSNDHTHIYNSWQGNTSLTGNPYPGGNFAGATSGVSAFHTHTFSTGGISANHNHSVSSQGSGGAHLNVQPTIIVNKILRIL